MVNFIKLLALNKIIGEIKKSAKKIGLEDDSSLEEILKKLDNFTIIHFIPFSTKNKQFFFVAFTVEKSTAISSLLFFWKDSKLLKCSLFIPLLSVALTKFAYLAPIKFISRSFNANVPISLQKKFKRNKVLALLKYRNQILYIANYRPKFTNRKILRQKYLY